MVAAGAEKLADITPTSNTAARKREDSRKFFIMLRFLQTTARSAPFGPSEVEHRNNWRTSVSGTFDKHFATAASSYLQVATGFPL